MGLFFCALYIGSNLVKQAINRQLIWYLSVYILCFVIEVRDNKACYSDDNLVEDDELPIYRDGEDRCKVYFTFNKDSITVKTQDCDFIYGGGLELLLMVHIRKVN